MFTRLLVAICIVSLFAGCPSLEPQLPKADTTTLIETWFREEGSADGTNTFEKGQEKCVKVEKAYSYGQPTESYAEVELIDLRIKKAGVPSTHTGRAKINLRQSSSGKWEVRSMSLLDGDLVKEFFYAKGNLPQGAPVAGPAPSATPPTSATTPAN